MTWISPTPAKACWGRPGGSTPVWWRPSWRSLRPPPSLSGPAAVVSAWPPSLALLPASVHSWGQSPQCAERHRTASCVWRPPPTAPACGSPISLRSRGTWAVASCRGARCLAHNGPLATVQPAPLCYPTGSGLPASPTPARTTPPREICNQNLLMTLLQPKCANGTMTLGLKKNHILVREPLPLWPGPTWASGFLR